MTDRLFDYKLNDQGIEEVAKAKKMFSDFQDTILSHLHDSREKSIVKSKLEEASFYVTKSIAMNTDNHSAIIIY